ncbi:hypothetical protein CRUP_033809 [Coryphaenoides rupestris]|nr:hypothetical protein CRUP_033809 [Coryphaenoides rupestris]
METSVVSMFGDRVKTWNTFSSPWVVSHGGYGTDEHPPGIKDSDQATHNMLKSHAEAWHVYNDKHRKRQDAKVALYVVFALMLAHVVAAILVAYRLLKTQKKLKSMTATS